MRSKQMVIWMILWVAVFTATSLCGAGERVTPVVRVVEACAPSVVSIGTERVVFLAKRRFLAPFGGSAQNAAQTPPVLIGQAKLNSIGSGVIVSADGVIVTNAHVIQMASKIFVVLNDGVAIEAKVIGTDAKNDLALIRILPPRPLKAVTLARDVLLGETVVAIGNPMGLQNSVTTGVVSGTGRNFTAPSRQVLTNLIQTDAPINPGSSGGALLNLDGELVGVNLAVASKAQSISFAIPFEKIDRLLQQYEAHKEKSES